MDNTKPIKREDFLKPLSREHHHGLLFCWKIRSGIRKNIEIKRVVNYANWFYQNYLTPHFYFENNFIYPVLPDSHQAIIQATEEHLSIKCLFENAQKDAVILLSIAQQIENHIRYEERIIFNLIQELISPKQIAQIESNLNNQPFIEFEDPFWEA